jgi:hypothetical protein
MHNKTFKVMFLSCVVFCLGSCGGNSHKRVNKKQRTHSDMKITHLNLRDGNLDLRLDYRSYVEKTLENISCEVSLNNYLEFIINNDNAISLDAFSKETIKFSSINFKYENNLESELSIEYSLSCTLKYNKGKEYVYKDSVLHLIPKSSYQYR